MADKTDPLDVAQLAKKDLSENAFPGAKQDFRVVFDRKIHEQIAAHAGEKLSLEICGFLVGQWYRDANGPYLHINESVRCNKAVSNAGDVTFTHEAWNEVNREMDAKYPDRSIVGWYHSHPNFGIFLSDRDQFIQDHTFNSPGQVAYVVDPVNGVEGVFHWREGKSVPCPHFWVGDKIHLSSQGAARKPSSASPAGQQPASAPKLDPMPPMSSITWILFAVCLLLLGYLVGSRYTAWEHNMLVKGVVEHYGLFKGLKPGMRENMDRVNENLQKIALAVDVLSKEHIALAGDAAEEKKKQWSEVVQALHGTNGLVGEIKTVYSLDPEEAAAVQQLINVKEAELENLRAQDAKDSAARGSAQKATTSNAAGANAAKTSASPAGSSTKPTENKPAATDKKP